MGLGGGGMAGSIGRGGAGAIKAAGVLGGGSCGGEVLEEGAGGGV